MGFQGDVAGIGLGELLQGLARGGREGVLTLRGGGLGATLGLQGGLIFLLPEPDEDPEVWRRRCERAWVKDPNQRIDLLRMTDIAYASRLEMMFQLLDCTGVHFRFEPGPLPHSAGPAAGGDDEEQEAPQLGRAETGAARGEMRIPVYCPGISVEFMLLEYARLSDECQTHGDALQLCEHDLPRALDGASLLEAMPRFAAECDGASSLIEIADRMGWPLRQCRASVQELCAKGLVRLADARELLVLTQKELAQNHFARAASRLTAWVRWSIPGPAPQGDAELLLVEWQRGKLPVVLANMDSRSARTLLRRIELVDADVRRSIARWQELRKYHRHDRASEVRLVHWQLRSDSEADAPAVGELLRIARRFQESGCRMRAGVMLRAVAARLPETTSMRLELGTRMLAVGLVAQGTPWVLEACRTLLQAGLADKSIGPLRALIHANPRDREARTLLAQAREQTVRGRRRKRNALVGLCLLLLFAAVAVVQMRVDQEYERRLNEIADQADRPALALALLEQAFPGDSGQRATTLRAVLRDRLMAQEIALRDVWLERYRDCELECTLGDVVVGLRRAIDMPEPPELSLVSESWPTRYDLLQQAAVRLEQQVAELGPPTDEAAVINAEQRLARLVADMFRLVDERPQDGVLEVFRVRLADLEGTLRLRGEKRAQERAERERLKRLQEQDFLLAAARSHSQAGDLERGVETFRRLVSMEGSERLAAVLAKEIQTVEAHWRAVQEARDLAAAGDHVAARATLAAVCPDLREHLLPWRVESRPEGARVRLPDGSARVSPFVLESSVGERLELGFELAGHEPERIVIDEPSDRVVFLSRLPEIWWRSPSPVESLPVPVEDGQVVANRAGVIARLDPAGKVAWTLELDSLGGVARTPVFLPRRQGWLLVVTEDGAAWIVDAASGRGEGPWPIGSPPTAGPTVTAGGAVASFADGRTAVWEQRLRPDLRSPSEDLPPAGPGSSAGMVVLRRRGQLGTSLTSPWTPWAVEIAGEQFRVRRPGSEQGAFTVRRQGEWVFVAWEAPNARIPQGRLWISDGAGLRAFLP